MTELLSFFEIKMLLTSLLLGIPAIWFIKKSPDNFPDKHIITSGIITLIAVISITTFFISAVILIWRW